MKLSLNRLLNDKELIDPLDIVPCDTNKCLYIFHAKGRSGKTKEILRLDVNGKLIRKLRQEAIGATVCLLRVQVHLYGSNVLSVLRNKHKLNEYSSDGDFIREIELSHARICHPPHAMKLTNNHFPVSHGEVRADPHTSAQSVRGRFRWKP